jgi:hypothetical protein
MMIDQNTKRIEDHSYANYQDKQREALTFERLLSQSNKVQKANNYYFESDHWIPNPYYGFGIISMLHQNDNNNSLINKIVEVQQELISLIEEKTKTKQQKSIYLLPAESFHQTIANALSNSKFDKKIIAKDLSEIYPTKIQEILFDYKSSYGKSSIEMKMIGIAILGNAVVMLGVFNDPIAYHSILNFRNHFYNHAISNSLGIKMTRPFLGHVTLAYIESDFKEEEKNSLAESIHLINRQIENEENIFYIDSSGLTFFNDLSSFVSLPNIKPINF